jgi:ABC-type sugar transport system substrate-binding protein
MHRSLAAAGVVLAMLAAGCGSDSDSSSAAAGGASGEANKQVTIGIVETESFSPYYATAKLGAESAGAEAGNAKIVVQGPVNPTAAAASNVAQNLATSLNPDGMGVNPCILAGWTQMLNQLSRTVPEGNVITWGCKPADSAEAAGSSPIKTFVGANDAESGYVAAKTAITEAKLGPETTGTALLGLCLQGVPILAARRAGEVKAVKELLPKVKPIEFVSKVDNAGALTAWTSALTKYPDLVYAGGACDQDAAALSTLKARGTAKDVVISAIDPTAKMLAQIKSGEMAGAVASQPWVIANVATHLLIARARGEEMPEGWVDTGGDAGGLGGHGRGGDHEGERGAVRGGHDLGREGEGVLRADGRSRPEGPPSQHEADVGCLRRLTPRSPRAASTWRSGRSRRSTTCRSRSAPARCTRCWAPTGRGSRRW